MELFRKLDHGPLRGRQIPYIDARMGRRGQDFRSGACVPRKIQGADGKPSAERQYFRKTVFLPTGRGREEGDRSGADGGGAFRYAGCQRHCGFCPENGRRGGAQDFGTGAEAGRPVCVAWRGRGAHGAYSQRDLRTQGRICGSGERDLLYCTASCHQAESGLQEGA